MRFLERLAQVKGLQWAINGAGQIHAVARSGRPTHAGQAFDPITAVVWEVAEEWWPSEKSIQAGMEKLGLRQHEAVFILLASDFPEPPAGLDDEQCVEFRRLRRALEEATVEQEHEDHPARGFWNWIHGEWPKVEPNWSPWPEAATKGKHLFDSEGLCTGCGLDERMTGRLGVRCHRPDDNESDDVNARTLLTESAKPHEFSRKGICQRCGTSREGASAWWGVHCRA